MAKDFWKRKQVIKPAKPVKRADLTLYLNNGQWNLQLIQNGDLLIEVHELDSFHFPGPIVTEASIPEAIAAFIEVSDDLLNRI